MLLNCGCGGWLEFLEQGQELPGFEGIEGVIGELAVGTAWSEDDDYGNPGGDFFEFGDEVVTGHVGHAGVGDDEVELRILLQGVDCFLAAVGGDDVEFCGLDDELAG